MTLSSSGQGYHPFTVETEVQIFQGSPQKFQTIPINYLKAWFYPHEPPLK